MIVKNTLDAVLRAVALFIIVEIILLLFGWVSFGLFGFVSVVINK